LALTYQHLINEFWSNAAANVNKTQTAEPKTKTLKTGKSNIKIINKQDNYVSVSVQPQFQQNAITVTTPAVATQLEAESTSLKDVNEVAAATHIIDQNGQVIPKLQADQTGINPTTLNSMVVNSDVTLAAFPNDPTGAGIMANQPSIPKYQQALQQPIAIQQQQLSHDTETGKVTFPKHVFSQARFVNKKQQQTLVSSEQPRVNCDICQKSLKTKKMLWAHKVAVHFGGNFPCNVCGKKCITGAELRRHMTSHSTERRFVCQYCGLAYKRWSHLYQHLRVHEEEKNFRCDVCHLNFKVQSELKDHCFAEHADGKQVQCSVCKHKLQTPLAVYHHSMKHTGTRDYICEICGSNFKRKQHLVTHMKTHLTDNKSNPDGGGASEVYECQACDESFNLKMDLKAHCTTLHPLEGDESATCRTCQKKLNVSHSVYLHGLRHFGTREFECTLCNQKFKRKAHLLRHTMDRHPEQPRERKKRTVQTDGATCELCQKSFKYKTALIKHMTSQHGILPSQTPSAELGIVIKKGIKRPHRCDICGKRFKSKNGLAKHKVNKHSAASEEGVTAVGDLVEMKKEPNVPKLTEEVEEDEVVDGEDEDESDTETAEVSQQQKSSSSQGEQMEIEIDQEGSSTTTTTTSMTSRNENVLLDKNTGANYQVVSLENYDNAVSTSQRDANQQQQVPHQVITVDEATGQIILMTTSGPPAQQQEIIKDGHKAANESDPGQVISVKSDGANEGNVGAQGAIISVQTTTGDPQDQDMNSSFERQQVAANQLRALTPTTQQQIAAGQIQIGQILNQDGVTLASVPIQSVQGVNNAQNIIDFSQGNNEQIVVLLSALNSENIQQM